MTAQALQTGGKLSYKIKGRRPVTIRRTPGVNASTGQPTSVGATMESDLDMDQVDVVWTHADGFPQDTIQHLVRMKDVNLVALVLLGRSVTDGLLTKELAQKIADKVKTYLPEHAEHSGYTVLDVPVGQRQEIVDQINVPAGASDEAVVMILEGKREKLAKRLGVAV